MTSAIADPPARPTTAIRMEKSDRLPIERIHPSKTNPRTHFDDAYIKDDLAVSIRDKGIIQPLVVRPHPKKPDDVEIVAGECRYRAAKFVGLELLPVIIREYTDEQVLEIQIEENTHRKDLTPLEEGAAYRRLITMNPDKHSAMTIATRIGKSPAYVWDYLKLNDLVPEAKAILDQERMAVGHAILIARLKPEDQKRAVDLPDNDSYGRHIDGLWRNDHGRLDIDDDGTAEEQAVKKDKYFGWKPCSVRELETWIRNHVRFDVEHAAKAQPLIFEQTAAVVQAAAEQPGRGRKVIAITHEYRVADDARDGEERTYGSQSWERADGKEKSKTCEYSVLGTVVAGRGQGTTLQVCVNREKCLTHFKQSVLAKQKSAKQREAGQTKQAAKTETSAAQKETAKRQAEQQKREAAAALWKVEGPLLEAEAVRQASAIKTLTKKQAGFALKDGVFSNGSHWRAEKMLVKALGATWWTKLAAAVVVLDVAGADEVCDSYEEFLERVTPYGLDAKAFAAIHAKHLPKQDAAAPAKKKTA